MSRCVSSGQAGFQTSKHVNLGAPARAPLLFLCYALAVAPACSPVRGPQSSGDITLQAKTKSNVQVAFSAYDIRLFEFLKPHFSMEFLDNLKRMFNVEGYFASALTDFDNSVSFAEFSNRHFGSVGNRSWKISEVPEAESLYSKLQAMRSTQNNKVAFQANEQDPLILGKLDEIKTSQSGIALRDSSADQTEFNESRVALLGWLLLSVGVIGIVAIDICSHGKIPKFIKSLQSEDSFAFKISCGVAAIVGVIGAIGLMIFGAVLEAPLRRG